MKIQRTIPPAAASIDFERLLHGFAGFFFGKTYQKRLEKELRDYFGVKHVFLVSSGKAALAVILSALKSISPDRNEVLIPAYTCFSVPSAIVKAGLKVSLCDINISTLDFDYKLLEGSIDEKTLCVIPSHLFGMPSDMNRINGLCSARRVFVVEDAAQALGVSHEGKMIGTIGDIGFFSLGRGKTITCGSGGIIVTNSNKIALAIEEVYSLLERPHITENIVEFLKVMIMTVFIRPSLYWFPAGLPFLKLGETFFYKDFPIKRLSAVKAGLLRNWKRCLEKANRIRTENAQYLCKGLGLGVCEFAVPFLRLPIILKNREIRDKIFSLSYKKRLGISRMYPTPINEIKEIRGMFVGKVFPRAKEVAEKSLTLPTHQLLSEKDIKKIGEFASKVALQGGFNFAGNYSETYIHSLGPKVAARSNGDL